MADMNSSSVELIATVGQILALYAMAAPA